MASGYICTICSLWHLKLLWPLQTAHVHSLAHASWVHLNKWETLDFSTCRGAPRMWSCRFSWFLGAERTWPCRTMDAPLHLAKSIYSPICELWISLFLQSYFFATIRIRNWPVYGVETKAPTGNSDREVDLMLPPTSPNSPFPSLYFFLKIMWVPLIAAKK